MPSYSSDSRALIGKNARSKWTISEAAYSLNALDISVNGAEPGHLHFHTDILTSRARVWMLNTDLKWEDVTRKWRNDWTKDSEKDMLAHPVHAKLRLTIDPDYRPHWIQFKSFVPKLKNMDKLQGTVDGIANFPEQS